MKKNIFFIMLLVLSSFNLFSINYVSSGIGPADWHTSTSWVPAGIPTSSDNVTINTGHTITLSARAYCNGLTVNGNIRWLLTNVNGTLTVNGNYSIGATGSEIGPGYIQFNTFGTTYTCLGTTAQNVYYSFYGSRTITAGSIVNKFNTTIRLQTSVILTNLGDVTTGTSVITSGNNSWINGANSILKIKNPGFMSGHNFNAGANNNTVQILYSSGTIPLTSSGFYNLTLGSTSAGAKNLASTTTIANNLTINSLNTLNSNGFNLSIAGNWVNNGTFTQGIQTVTFNGTGPQSIGGTASTTFYNLSKNGASTVTLARNTVVNNLLTISSGIFDASTFGLTGTGGLTMPAGELQLGKTGAIVPELSGAYTLTAGKVIFNGAGAQTIRGGITYFNVDAIGSGTKSLAGTLNMNGSLLISSTLDVTAGNFAINLAGNWTNNGSFVQRTGTVTLNGTVAQNLFGASATTFENLTLNNTSGATISSGTYLLDGALTLSNGTFNAGGMPFTMTSTAGKTARIAPITGTGAIAGNFTIERFVTGRDTTWADLSSPVQNATFADWANELVYVYYGYAPPYQYPTQYTYSEPADDFVAVTSAGTALTPGKGYEVFLTGNFNYSNFPGQKINLNGVPNQGNQNLSGLISFSGAAKGSNLVGNPFASSISWSSVFAASSNIKNTYDTYDYLSGNYATFGLGTEIGSGQGFWVYTTGAAPTLQIPESAKTTSSNSSIRSSIVEPFFTLKLSSTDINNNYYHTLKISADNNSFDGWDDNDHPFRKSPNLLAPSINAVINGKKSVINSFSLVNENYSMPVETRAGISGYYKIEASGFENISEYSCIKLEDKLLNKMVDLNSENSYSFQMNSGDKPDRFVAHFSKSGDCRSALENNAQTSTFDNSVLILPTTEGNSIEFKFNESTPVNITVTNILGQTLVDAISMNVQSQTEIISLPSDFSGMYIVKIESSKESIIKKYVRK